jgi:D-glycero-alpha-D-manno-heptose-7-phosphate kinase
MIITRSPLRISLGGGGTDLPSYYREHGGFLIAAAIDKYVYIAINRAFVPRILLRYSRMEDVATAAEVQHPIVREALQMLDVGAPLEMHSVADIPAGTGLGSSGSFTTALLRALHAHRRTFIEPAELAAQACQIEIDRLGEPIGKQDQYIAAYGGLTCFRFLPDDRVEAWPLQLTTQTLYRLEDHLLMFFTGFSRSASTVLQEQHTRSLQHDAEMMANLHFVKELGEASKDALEGGDLEGFAELMNIHWQHKKKRSGSMSNSQIDDWYDLALNNGALGGKLIGAGGGGFLMFYSEDRARLCAAMREQGLEEVRFRFDTEGARVVAHS